jgi:hypothetical protein
MGWRERLRINPKVCSGMACIIMPTPGLCRLDLGSAALPRISLLASFERGDIIWMSST